MGEFQDVASPYKQSRLCQNGIRERLGALRERAGMQCPNRATILKEW
jgi:hypothetical protein